MGPDRLETYNAKRRFDATPEPPGAPAAPGPRAGDAPRFVVQKHAARALHYDVRFEADGVLVSWAVPKGPSYDPAVKRLAVHVEDHPLDYRTFEGTVPAAQYGAGAVIVWDEGTYRNRTTRDGRPVPVSEAVAAGHLSVELDGVKLRGGWSLTRTGTRGGKEQWVLVKRHDDAARPGDDVTARDPASVRSGRAIEQVRADPAAPTWTRERATWAPPMLATPSDLDALTAEPPGRWQFERKLDGLRCVAVRNGDEVELWSRNHLSFTARFPRVVEALRALAPPAFVIDGELVADGGPTASAFGALQAPGGAAAAVLHAFDLLSLLGRDTTGLALADRQRLLAQAVGVPPPAGLAVVQPLPGEPGVLLDRACAEGWEGLVAKHVDAPYRGGRSPAWRKLKCTASQELVVGGFTDPTGARTGFGALLVGYHDEGGLRFAGRVGTGFDEATLVDLHRRLQALEVPDPPFVDAPPLRGAHWARPELVAEVRFTEWTADGRLRHPSFLGLRDDKPAAEVVREQRPGTPPSTLPRRRRR
ncbi:MAG TPA: non-homologous end-joining DNA ligase [Acidimicrobiales bacterium]|nr:non-homologous end-joining DNA ligase [Acidimicrobiales bacterium]